MLKKLLSILLLALCVLPAWSWDFCQKNKDGVMLYYNYYDDDFQMCEVAYNKDAQYTGKFDTLWIPDVVVLPNKNEGWEDTILAVVSIEGNTFKYTVFPYVHLPEFLNEIGDLAFHKHALRKKENPPDRKACEEAHQKHFSNKPGKFLWRVFPGSRCPHSIDRHPKTGEHHKICRYGRCKGNAPQPLRMKNPRDMDKRYDRIQIPDPGSQKAQNCIFTDRVP